MSTSVKYFNNGMPGAPQLTNNQGDLVAMLDACLVNGFGLTPISLLSANAGVATAATGAAHGFAVGQVVLIAGADQPEYNGQVRVTAATTTTFSYVVAGTPTSPATTATTLSAKVAPLGWEIAFTGTGKRAYRSPNVLSNRPYLRVDDSLDPVWTPTFAKYAKVTAAQGMADIDTFVGAHAPFDPALPTLNEIGTGSGSGAINGWFKWYYARASSQDDGVPTAFNRPWVLVGDDRTFYLFISPYIPDVWRRQVYAFGDFASYRPADGFNCFLQAFEYKGATATTYANFGDYPDTHNEGTKLNAGVGRLLLGGYLQVGTPPWFVDHSLNCSGSDLGAKSGYSMGLPWPNGADYGLHVHPVYIKEVGSNVMRGVKPGQFAVLVKFRLFINTLQKEFRLFFPPRLERVNRGNMSQSALRDVVVIGHHQHGRARSGF